MDEQYLWMKMWMKKLDGLFYECCQHTLFLQKNEQRNKVEEIYVGLC
jgi:hypothetical protein